MHEKVTEVEGWLLGWEVEKRSYGCRKCWREILRIYENVTECSADSRNIDKSLQKVPLMHKKIDGKFLRSTESWCKFMEGPADARKDDGSWRKVVLTQRKFTECLQPHGNLTEGPAAIRKVHGRSCGCTESWWKLMEGCAGAKKVDGMSAAAWEVDERSRRRTESWRKMADRPATAQSVVWRWRKVARSHGMLTESPENVQKLTEVYGRSCSRTKSWRKFPQLHVNFT